MVSASVIGNIPYFWEDAGTVFITSIFVLLVKRYARNWSDPEALLVNVYRVIFLLGVEIRLKLSQCNLCFICIIATFDFHDIPTSIESLWYFSLLSAGIELFMKCVSFVVQTTKSDLLVDTARTVSFLLSLITLDTRLWRCLNSLKAKIEHADITGVMVSLFTTTEPTCCVCLGSELSVICISSFQSLILSCKNETLCFSGSCLCLDHARVVGACSYLSRNFTVCYKVSYCS